MNLQRADCSGHFGKFIFGPRLKSFVGPYSRVCLSEGPYSRVCLSEIPFSRVRPSGGLYSRICLSEVTTLCYRKLAYMASPEASCGVACFMEYLLSINLRTLCAVILQTRNIAYQKPIQ